MDRLVVTGLKQIVNNPIRLDYEMMPNFKFDDRNVGSNGLYDGVYVIYDYFGECLYVGKSKRLVTSTGPTSIRQRLGNHYTSANSSPGKIYFTEFAYWVQPFTVYNSDPYQLVLDILLLERLLIRALNPIFNSDAGTVRSVKFHYLHTNPLTSKRRALTTNKYFNALNLTSLYDSYAGPLGIPLPPTIAYLDYYGGLLEWFKSTYLPAHTTKANRIADYYEQTVSVKPLFSPPVHP